VTTATVDATAGRSLGGRIWGGIVAVWGAVVGAAPHVLHHAGPLAGAAVLAGFGGRVLFFALGLVVAFPMLRRLYRRFGSFAAPALAVGVFAAMFTLSSLVIAPRLTGSSDEAPAPSIEQPTDHAGHHRGSPERR